MKKNLGYAIAGLCAGAVTGLFGAGGGMVLIPLLHVMTDISEDGVFPSSVAIILPICVLSLLCTTPLQALPLQQALPYLIGSAIGGCLVGKFGKKIPTIFLHRFLGVMILWGGIRNLC